MNIYDDSSLIDAYLYLSTYFDILQNQVDLFAVKNEIQADQHIYMIKIIKDHEYECIQNCSKNFNIFQEKIKYIIEKRIELYKESSGTRDYVEKNLQLRKEWIEARRDIFKRNLFFIENFGDKTIGSLVMTEEFCLDDLQIDIIK